LPLIRSDIDGIGWQSTQSDILRAAAAARSAPIFDEQARSSDVARQIIQAKKFALWPLLIAVGAFILPHAWVWVTAILVGWGYCIRAAFARGADAKTKLAAETEQLRKQVRQSADSINEAILHANEGKLEALDFLLGRWLSLRPKAIQGFTAQISGTPNKGWMIVGDAIRRDGIPAGVPRAGRGDRVVYDKRKAAEIDEDLTELNALAVISLLSALFSLPTRQRVTISISIFGDEAGPLPWITMFGMVGNLELASLITANDQLTNRPSECIRVLGGDVGHCRSQRLTPAGQPWAAADAEQTTARTQHEPSTELVSTIPAVPALAAPTYGANAAPMEFGDSRESSRFSQPIPPLPKDSQAGEQSPATIVGGILPTQSNVRGEFSVAARRFVAYGGDPTARFVQFEAFWPKYESMSPGQLRFYFKWRNEVRSGGTPRTELSYIFVHIYELLHIIGADSGRHAAEQIESLRQRYRSIFPKLDHDCIRWTTDLYAKETDPASTMEFVRRAAVYDCQLGSDEALLLADDHWAAGNYAAMPLAEIAILAGEQRLGDNKFCSKYNNDGWVEHAYRDALQVTDRTYKAKFGSTLRELTVQNDGTRPIVRDAFTGAVYDWKRQPVVLGTVPSLHETSVAVQTFHNAVRYTENILRKEKQFRGRLRGVEVGPLLSAALDAHFTDYVKTTRPRTAIRLDLARASDIARESEEIRARLLVGMDDAGDTLTIATSDTPSNSEKHVEATPATTSDALLADLNAIREAVDSSSEAARSILGALLSAGWEAGVHDSSLVQAAGGLLVQPLINELNHQALLNLGSILVVQEGDQFVVEDDFRDEVYMVVHGTLDGFSRETTDPRGTAPTSVTTASNDTLDSAHAEGFGPLDFQALRIIFLGGPDIASRLSEMASSNATTPLLLIDRINEVGLACSYGDLLINANTTPPSVMDDAVPFIANVVRARDQPTEALSQVVSIEQ
jgi:hypothetical protein